MGNTSPHQDRISHAIPVATSWLLGSVFLWAALQKAIDPRDTLAAAQYIFGEASPLNRPFLYTLVASEIALASVLIAGVAPRLSITTAIVVLFVFSGWLAYLKITNAPVSCGCGSNPKFLRDDAAYGLVRNSALIGIAGVALWLYRGKSSLEHTYSTGMRASDLAPAPPDVPLFQIGRQHDH